MKLKSKKTSKHLTEKWSVDKSDLIVVKNFVNGKLMSVSLEGKGPHGSRPELVKPSFKEFIKTGNPFHDYKEAAEHCYDWKSPTDFENVDFDAAVKDGLIYYFYSSGHVLFDVDKRPVPLPHMFDYIATDFHSNAIDIDKAKEELRKHPWVLNGDSLKIKEIPYYNAQDRNHTAMCVNVCPDSKTYKKMYDMALKLRGEQYFSIALRELVIGKCYGYPKWDPLKIHKFKKKEKSVD